MTEINELFSETYKAIDIAKNIEEKAMKELTYDEQLEILKDSINKARSREEYAEYEKQIEKIKLDKKFSSVYIELSDDERETIQHNYEIELSEARKAYDDRKDKVVKEYEKAMKKIIPLINEMNMIKSKNMNASYVEELLNNNVYSRSMSDRTMVLGPALKLYPNQTYSGTLVNMKKLFSLIGKALKSPNQYKTLETKKESMTIYKHL